MLCVDYSSCKCLMPTRPRRFKKTPVEKHALAIVTRARGAVFHEGETVYVSRVWGNSIFLLKLDKEGNPVNPPYVDKKSYYKFL